VPFIQELLVTSYSTKLCRKNSSRKLLNWQAQSLSDQSTPQDAYGYNSRNWRINSAQNVLSTKLFHRNWNV